jgi:transaldolase
VHLIENDDLAGQTSNPAIFEKAISKDTAYTDGITTDLNVAIDRAFREAVITIPFPQRDVHITEQPH